MIVSEDAVTEPARLPSLRKQRFFRIASMIIMLAAAVGCTWFFWLPGEAFDREKWSTSDYSQHRLKMADRLLAEGTLHGKSRAEIVELLGEPTEGGYFLKWDLAYILGPERGFMGIDSEWLVFRLDANGRVVEYRLTVD